MNSKSARLRRKFFRANRAVVEDRDPGKMSFLLNLYEEELNKQRYINSKKDFSSRASAFFLSELAQKGVE
jgi:hypothetical protein